MTTTDYGFRPMINELASSTGTDIYQSVANKEKNELHGADPSVPCNPLINPQMPYASVSTPYGPCSNYQGLVAMPLVSYQWGYRPTSPDFYEKKRFCELLKADDDASIRQIVKDDVSGDFLVMKKSPSGRRVRTLPIISGKHGLSFTVYMPSTCGYTGGNIVEFRSTSPCVSQFIAEKDVCAAWLSKTLWKAGIHVGISNENRVIVLESVAALLFQEAQREKIPADFGWNLTFERSWVYVDEEKMTMGRIYDELGKSK